MMQVYMQVAGITFRQKDDKSMLTFRPAGDCEIVPEPDNPYDDKALKVMNQGKFVGYIPGPKSQSPEVQGKLHDMLAAGEPFTVKVEEVRYRDGEEWNDKFIGKLGSIKLCLECADEAKPEGEEPVVLKSSNEAGVSVEFYPTAHAYYYQNKRLQSVTGLVSRTVKPFNAQAIAERCAPSWGMEVDDIKEMWKMAGEAASGFGTSIHALMESYQRFGDRALSKHPVLRGIVTSFPWWDTEVLAVEALVTCVDRGVCGLVDRVERHNGRLRVGDYKFIHDAEDVKSTLKNLVFDEVPSSKAGKMQVQFSLYGDMLEISGREVDDTVTAYVYDGAWRRLDMPRIHGALARVQEVL